MQHTGLYYPYVHLRDESWAKAAALYWKRLARVVPDGFPVRDESVVKELRQANFLVDTDPARAAAAVAPAFIAAVEEYGTALRRQYAVAGRPFTAQRAADPRRIRPRRQLAGLYPQEVARELESALVEAGLAERSKREWVEDRPIDWVAVDAMLAWVYKCALTEELARRTAFVPVTDQIDAHAAGDGWSSEQIARALLGGGRGPAAAEVESRIALMAVQCVLPADLENVPIEKIIKLRTDYADEFALFAAAIDTASAELRSATREVTDSAAFEIHLNDTFEHHIAQPLESLRRAMRGLKLETMSTALTVKAEVTVAGGAIGLLGGAATAVGAGLAFTTIAARQTAAHQRDSLVSSSPASYLLRIERELTPQTLVRRAGRAAMRMAGLGI
ncbi:hypothetical protein GCM10010430_60190 [Kitasatospora cystarginea]|uniref:Uncharacterized protein n=1 Tax=Kitasatospora cystarginea TaxID=58350 RepID=A0ABP5RN73_9ACTN